MDESIDRPALVCFQTNNETASTMRTASGSRDWMDAYEERFPYRCLPIVQANTCGWELLSSHDIAIVWNGGHRLEDLQVKNLSGSQPRKMAASSWFARGIATFHSDYVFKISEGYQLLATGPLNRPKHGIAALAGLLDTQRLPFTFTMNWMMTKPGTVVFEKDEPYCLILPINTASITLTQPEIRPLTSDRDLLRMFESYQKSRSSFIEQQRINTSGVPVGKWQKFYVRGLDADEVRIASPLKKTKSRDPIRTGGGCPYSSMGDIDVEDQSWKDD